MPEKPLPPSPAIPMSSKERRRTHRRVLALPTHVTGFGADGSTWEELTTTDEVASTGCSFPLKHKLELGQVLRLSIPLPKDLRQYDLNDASYQVYALIRGLSHRADHARVGVMLFGKFPPRGFHEKPAARYLLPSDAAALNVAAPDPPPPPDTVASASSAGSTPPTAPAHEPTPHAAFTAGPSPPLPVPAPASSGAERRSFPRADLFVNFLLQHVDEWGAVLQEELTVADNISKCGARVLTTLEFQKGDVILIQEAGGDFAARTEVVAVRRGQDGITRLHLKFLGRQAPPRILRLGGLP